MQNKNILISGAGIAGLTLAYWLKRFGFNPTVVEHYPEIRQGGYMIDFFGLGVDVAEKMNLLDAIENIDVKIEEITFVDGNGKREGGISMMRMRKLLGNRAFNLLRSDLARILYYKIEKNVDFIFGTSISYIENNPDGVTVTFENGTSKKFDLLIGADGLHSNVRTLIFGDESQFEQYYGFYTASYTIANPDHEQLFLSHTIPCRQVGLYAVDSKRSAAFFLFKCPQKLLYGHHDIEQQKWILRQEFARVRWKCGDILEKIDEADDFYFDEVSQVKMDAWSKGRITLVGDACDCPSLLSGQGSTLAMVGAYILAGELKRANGQFEKAYSEYQNQLQPFMASKQKIARTFANSFLPKNWWGIWVRNTFTNAMFLPGVSKWFAKQFLTDNFKLRDYHALMEDPVVERSNGQSKSQAQVL